MTQKYRILHLGKYYPPEYGGIESVAEALAEDHAEAGHCVKVLCFSRVKSRIEKSQSVIIRRFRQWFELKSQPINLFYIFAGFKALLRADIVHLHAPNLFAAAISLAAPRRASLVVHWHSDIDGKGVMGRIVRPIEWLMLRRADAIVCTSLPYCDASASLRQWREKINFIPIGINDSSGASGADGGSGAEGAILFVGRLVPYKGLPVLLKALAQMRERAPLVIVGVGPEEPLLRKLVTKLGLQGRVSFRGSVDQGTLEHLFNTAAVFCLPSVNRLEAFGVVLLEAMRAGCPVVSSDIPGSGVSWVNSEGLLVSVGDDRAMASQLDEILSDPALRNRISEKARTRFEMEFKRQRMSNEFLLLYGRLRHK